MPKKLIYKHCYRCLGHFPLSRFHVRAVAKDGRHSSCKLCRRKYLHDRTKQLRVERMTLKSDVVIRLRSLAQLRKQDPSEFLSGVLEPYELANMIGPRISNLSPKPEKQENDSSQTDHQQESNCKLDQELKGQRAPLRDPRD